MTLPSVVHRLVLVVVASITYVPASVGNFICEGPSAGCSNGLWNQDACVCQCIPPYCPDSWGDCLLPSGSCGGNPWADCTEGVDCPWWIDSDAENCSTGNEIPAGVWTIYPGETVCCEVNRPYTIEVCDRSTSDPTKAPVAAPKFDDLYEVIPIKFNLYGISEEVDARDLKDEMLAIVKNVLIDLSQRQSSLRIKTIEENLLPPVSKEDASTPAENNALGVYFDVTIIRSQEVKDFGPIIIQWIKESYEDIVAEIKDFINQEYFINDVDMNWCTTEKSQLDFNVCNDEVVPVKTRFQRVDGITTADFVSKLVEVYEDILSSVPDLDITKVVVKDTTVTDDLVDVTLDVYVHQKHSKDLAPIIYETVEVRQKNILDRIQSYSEEILGEIDWCIDYEINAFAQCEKEAVEAAVKDQFEPTESSLFPLWAIITIATLSLVFCCAVSCCIVIYRRRTKDETKNEANMVNFLNPESGNYVRKGTQHTQNSQPTVSDRSGGRRMSSQQQRRHSTEQVPGGMLFGPNLPHMKPPPSTNRHSSVEQQRRTSQHKPRRDLENNSRRRASRRQSEHTSSTEPKRRGKTRRRSSDSGAPLKDFHRSSRRSSRRLSLESEPSSRASDRKLANTMPRGEEPDGYSVISVNNPMMLEDSSHSVDAPQSTAQEPPLLLGGPSYVDAPSSAQKERYKASRRSSLEPDGDNMQQLVVFGATTDRPAMEP